MVDFLLYAANLDASVATRSKISGSSVRKTVWYSVRCQRTVDEGVQDRHGTVGDTGIGVNLLQNCIRRVSKDPNARVKRRPWVRYRYGPDHLEKTRLGPRSK